MATSTGAVGIADELRARIRRGELHPGDRAPSTRAITREWGVAMATATKALGLLVGEGALRMVPGVGSVVTGTVEDGTADARDAPGRARRARPAPAGTALSRERIVRTAIAIADAEGMATFSVRRVAAELGVATMSLYRHVDDREDLVTTMVDEALGEETLPDPAGVDRPDAPAWRARLELVARRLWGLFRRHPWLAPTMSLTRPQGGPKALRHTEWILGALEGLGLDHDTRFHVYLTLINHVRGTAVNIEPELAAEAETGLTGDEWTRAHMARLAPAVVAERYPLTAGLLFGPEVELDLDELFEFGLARLLDGLAALLP